MNTIILVQLHNASSTISNVVIEDFRIDGIDELAYMGVGGDSYAKNILVQRGDISAVGNDPARIFKNSIFRHNYVHDLRGWTVADGTYVPNAVDNPSLTPNPLVVNPHLDCCQALYGQSVIEENWLQNTTGDSSTSVILVKPDSSEDIVSYLIRANYIEGGKAYPIHLVTKNISLTNPGQTVSGVVVRDNLISKNYGNYPADPPYSVASIYSDCATFSGNVYAEDRSPIPVPFMTARPNLLASPSDLTNAAWTKSVVSVAAGATGSGGGATAFTVLEAASTGYHDVDQWISKASSVKDYRMTARVKANGRSFAKLAVAGAGYSGGATCFFDLSTGTVGSSYNYGTMALPYLAKIQAIGTVGWYQIEIRFKSDATNQINYAVQIASADSVDNYAGDITKGLLIESPYLAELPPHL